MKTLFELVDELVKIHSTADRPQELLRSIEYVDAQFQGFDSLVKKRYERNQKYAIVVSTQDTLTPDILLMAHLDVVPAEDELFQIKQEGGRVFGRGVCDNKGPAAVMIRLMQEIAGWEDAPSIAAMFTTDEEIGGPDGAGYLIHEIGYKPKVGLVPDNGQQMEDLVLENKGIAMIRLTARGKQGHGSRPWEGENAIDKLIENYLKVKNRFHQTDTPDVWGSTINIGMIGGGKAANQIPDEASCTIDLRFPEGPTATQVIEEIQRLVPQIEVEAVVTGEACSTSADDPFVKAYAEVLDAELHINPKHERSCSGHDGRYLSAIGVPIIVSRPLSGGQHSPDEWMDMDSLQQFEDLYRAYIRKLHSMM